MSYTKRRRLMDILCRDYLFKKKLEEYAEIIVTKGVNLQQNQPVILRGSIETAILMRLISKYCYIHGAKYVYAEYNDAYLDKIKYEFGSDSAISYSPKWKSTGFEEMCYEDACFIKITGEDPDLFKDISPELIATSIHANSKNMKIVNKFIMNNHVSWTVVAALHMDGQKKFFRTKIQKKQSNYYGKKYSNVHVYN